MVGDTGVAMDKLWGKCGGNPSNNDLQTYRAQDLSSQEQKVAVGNFRSRDLSFSFLGIFVPQTFSSFSSIIGEI